VAGFAQATAAEAVGDGVYAVELDEQWTVGERPNGGYLLALMARAGLAEHAGHPHVLAASAHFSGAPMCGAAEVVARVLRAGRFASQVRATLRQGGRELVHVLLTLGHLGEAPERWSDAPAVELPPPSECERLPVRRSERQPMRLWDAIELLADPATLGWARRAPSGHAESRSWFVPGADADPLLMLLVALDCLPVVTLELGSRGWVPTLELTAYLRALPAGGPWRVRQRAQLVRHGLVDEQCQVWDGEGRLVGQASQLAAVRFPSD